MTSIHNRHFANRRIVVVAVLLGIAGVSTPVRAAPSSSFAAVLEKERAKQALPGVVASVVIDGEVVFAGGAGFADVESKRPMTATSVVFPGSLSKVFTTVAVLQLVDANRAPLDAPASRWIPALRRRSKQRQMSLRHLLSHTSGLPSEANFTYWFTGAFPSNRDVVNAAADAWVTEVPLKKASYSNLGFAVLGRVIERLTGRAYVNAVRSTIFAPLGMASSGGGCPNNAARGYSPEDTLLPTSLVPFAGVGEKVGRRHLREYCGAKGMTPAFGLHTTALDMSQFMIALLPSTSPATTLKPRILSEKAKARLAEQQPGGRTLGLRRAAVDGQTLLRHDGWFAAHKSHLLLDRANGIGVYVTANADDAKPDAIAKRLWRAARAAVATSATASPTIHAK